MNPPAQNMNIESCLQNIVYFFNEILLNLCQSKVVILCSIDVRSHWQLASGRTVRTDFASLTESRILLLFHHQSNTGFEIFVSLQNNIPRVFLRFSQILLAIL